MTAQGSLRSTVVGLAMATAVTLGVAWAMAGAPKPAPPHSVTLHWMPSASAVLGYNVYRAEKTGGPYRKVNRVFVAVTQYTDQDVKAGQTYFYVVRAVDANGIDGPPSQEIRARVPAA